MNIEELREYCLKKVGATEDFPFDEDTLVFKVMGKMFLLTGLDHKPLNFNVKCDPELAIELREQYDGDVIPGFHMNKSKWNTVEVEGAIPEKELYKMIDHSYDEVVKSFTKKLKEELKSLAEKK